MSEELVSRLRTECPRTYVNSPTDDLMQKSADRIEFLERLLQKEVTQSALEALAISETNNELAVQLSSSQARLSEAGKVLEELSGLVIRAKEITPNHLVNWHYSAELALSQSKAFLATLGEENGEP